MIKSILKMRAGSGLGDSIYLQSIARYFVEQGHDVEVSTDYPDVFLPLAPHYRTIPMLKAQPFNVIAHYTQRRQNPAYREDQFQSMCITAGIPADTELRMDWVVRNQALVDDVTRRAAGRKIVLVTLPREPFGRVDGMGLSLFPDCRLIDAMVAHFGDRAFVVQVGALKAKSDGREYKARPLFTYKRVDLDLTDKTSISDLLDLSLTADLNIGQCSWIIPMAESFNKPLIVLWGHGVRTDRNAFMQSVTPEKVLHGKKSFFAWDDWPIDKVIERAQEAWDA